MRGGGAEKCRNQKCQILFKWPIENSYYFFIDIQNVIRASAPHFDMLKRSTEHDSIDEPYSPWVGKKRKRLFKEDNAFDDNSMEKKSGEGTNQKEFLDLNQLKHSNVPFDWAQIKRAKVDFDWDRLRKRLFGKYLVGNKRAKQIEDGFFWQRI